MATKNLLNLSMSDIETRINKLKQVSDQLKHECGIGLVHLKKPLNYYNEKYGSYMYGIDKMFLMMEKQKNRGQDGAGFASCLLYTSDAADES